MHPQIKKTIMTSARAFQLDGLEKELSAGVYNVESENDVFDGMFLPDYLRTLPLIYLHSTPGGPGLTQTLTVPWEAIEPALLRDQCLAVVAPPEPGVDENLPESIVRLLMHSDDISQNPCRYTNSRLAKRTFSHAQS